MAAPLAALLKVLGGVGMASLYKKYGKKIGKEADKMKDEKERKNLKKCWRSENVRKRKSKCPFCQQPCNNEWCSYGQNRRKTRQDR